MTAASTLLTFLHTGNPTGLKFVVEHGDARCLFDFGPEHAPGRTPFSLGLAPRAGRELADLLAVGAAPALDGVYAGDPWDGRTHVFISHMHLDHTGLVPMLGPDVPLYFPAEMEAVRAAADRSGYLSWRRPTGSGVADGEVIGVGPIRVRFVAVDHDLPGATGFLVETPDATIAFTGDHRWHGLHPELTQSFAECARGADVLIQEGVGLGPGPIEGDPPPLTEAEAIDELGRALAEASGLVIVNCYGMNRERVAGLAARCRAAGRRLLMEPHMAAMAGWPDVLSQTESVREDPRGHCLQLGFESLPLLIDLHPPTGSVWIQSGGAPMGAFDPASTVLEAWAERFGLEIRTITSSGHSRPEDIVRMVTAVRPKLVLPVHSRAPEMLQVPGIPSFLPRAGVAYRVLDIAAGVSSAPSG
ncbi:MAG TPA: MBL fold metallo-hydrolase [Candidatus Dormibacteraeota bacterium]|nr:MBL fold metallo-hydrolase [Candidatus Dormibacteraeota bacterium]